jgi:hypothetical protein
MRELSMHILDVLENALDAGATCVELIIQEDRTADLFAITVRDNGHGMDQAQLERIYDPFFTTRNTRRVGLGVPLFKAATERCGGDLVVTSEPGKGTTLHATFQHSHIDRAPLGNIVSTLMAILLSDRCALHYIHSRDGGLFEFHTDDIKTKLVDVPLSHPAVRKWLRDFIAEGEKELDAESTPPAAA